MVARLRGDAPHYRSARRCATIGCHGVRRPTRLAGPALREASARCARQSSRARDALCRVGARAGLAPHRRAHRSRCRRYAAARSRAADAALSQRMGHARSWRAPRSPPASASSCRASTRAARMLALHRDRARWRATSRRAIAAFPSRARDCPLVAPADDRLGARAGRRVRRRAGGAWATAAATTTGCCRCCARTCRASPARSTCRSSSACPRPRTTSRSTSIVDARRRVRRPRRPRRRMTPARLAPRRARRDARDPDLHRARGARPRPCSRPPSPRTRRRAALDRRVRRPRLRRRDDARASPRAASSSATARSACRRPAC